MRATGQFQRSEYGEWVWVIHILGISNFHDVAVAIWGALQGDIVE